MEIGWNEWGSLHWYRLDSETCGRSVINGSTTVHSSTTGHSGSGPCSQRNRNIADDLRDRHPIGHTFAAREISKLDAALGDVTLQVRQRIRAILIQLALYVIFQLSPQALS